jgi:hypothetical protein
MEVPITAVTGASNANTGTIKTWVSSSRNGMRIDRMAIPAINTALIPSAQKDAFNAADPNADAATYRSVAANTITTLRNAVDPLFGGAATQGGGPLGNLPPSSITAALLPYVFTVDFSKTLQFPNGRRPQDDVIDTVLGLVLNRGGAAGISDGVNANDKAFGSAFPYLAEPTRAATGGDSGTTPPPSGGGAVRPPNTGDAGLLDRDTMWIASAGLFLLAVTFGSAGLLAVFRARSR